MQEYYILNPQLIVVGKVQAEDYQKAKQQAELRGPGFRATSTKGMTAEEAERFVQEELKDRK